MEVGVEKIGKRENTLFRYLSSVSSDLTDDAQQFVSLASAFSLGAVDFCFFSLCLLLIGDAVLIPAWAVWLLAAAVSVRLWALIDSNAVPKRADKKLSDPAAPIPRPSALFLSLSV